MAIPFTCIGERKMKRYYDMEFRGKHLRLYCSMRVMLDTQEAYDMDFTDLLQGTQNEVFDRRCFLFSLLSYEGKRLYPEEPIDTIAISDLDDIMPFEYLDVIEATNKATELGFKREYEPEEVDEGLVELKKKIQKESSEPKQ